jgi:hypothetical protein
MANRRNTQVMTRLSPGLIARMREIAAKRERAHKAGTSVYDLIRIYAEEGVKRDLVESVQWPNYKVDD